MKLESLKEETSCTKCKNKLSIGEKVLACNRRSGEGYYYWCHKCAGNVLLHKKKATADRCEELISELCET